MPLYPIDCPCGSIEGWSRKPLPSDATEVECFECDNVVPIGKWKNCQMPAVHGLNYMDEGLKGRYHKQAGRHFTSSKEMEAWAESKNYDIVDSSDKAWTSIKAENRAHADREAKTEGFDGMDDRRVQIKENSVDYMHAAAQKKIDKHHDEHGTEGMKTTDQVVKESNKHVDL